MCNDLWIMFNLRYFLVKYLRGFSHLWWKHPQSISLKPNSVLQKFLRSSDMLPSCRLMGYSSPRCWPARLSGFDQRASLLQFSLQHTAFPPSLPLQKQWASNELLTWAHRCRFMMPPSSLQSEWIIDCAEKEERWMTEKQWKIKNQEEKGAERDSLTGKKAIQDSKPCIVL